MSEYKCPKCDGIGYILYRDERGYEWGKKCDCQKVEVAKQRMETSGLPSYMLNVGFKDYIEDLPQRKAAKEKAISYYKGFTKTEGSRNNSILFCGQVGSGKTMLSMAIANNLMQQANIECYYMPYRESISRLKRIVNNDLEYERAINKYKHPRVLLIDDLFKGRLTEADVNAMFEIVNYRYLNNKPVIVTTEKSPDEIQDFDAGIGSRILEMCKGNIIYMRGKELNYRLEGII